MSESAHSLVEKMLAFLSKIGIETKLVALESETFLPGIDIRHGVLLVDESRLGYPGDILHEAGHLAIVSSRLRRTINHDAGSDPGEEMAAIAWSYAAALHLKLDPAIVFHAEGYRGGSRAIVENFAEGRYVGVPVLEWLGLTVQKATAAKAGVPAYPHMLKWAVD